MTRLEKVYATILLVVFGAIVLHAPLSVGFGSLLPDYAIAIKSWKEILLLLATPLALVIVTRRRLWGELTQDWVFRLIIGYTTLHLVLAGVFRASGETLFAGLAIDLRYVLFFSLIYVLVRIAPNSRHLLLKIALAGAAIVVGFATLQLFLPADSLKHIGYGKDTIAPYLTVDQNPDFVRVNSTLRGPNPLGAYVAIVLALLASTLVYRRFDLRSRKVFVGIGVLSACSLIALWISYSRSALLAAVIGLMVVVAVVFGKKWPRYIWASLLIGGLLLGGGVVAARETSFVSNVILHEDPEEGGAVNSNDGHLLSLQDGAARMARQPLGAGIGSTGSASLRGDQAVIIENQYLFVAHETGWLGLGLFLTIFCLILQQLWLERRDWLSLGMFASGVGLGVIGLLQPVWVDDTVSIVWWGLAAIALGSVKLKHREHPIKSPDQKTA